MESRQKAGPVLPQVSRRAVLVSAAAIRPWLHWSDAASILAARLLSCIRFVRFKFFFSAKNLRFCVSVQ